LLTKVNDTIHVEAFELSPRNESVNTTIGRLQRQFPGPTFALDQATFNEPGMQHTIAETLARMSHQSVAGTKLKVKKAGQWHDEDRDTTSPTVVTELFTAFLRPRCDILHGLQIHKNTREEVLWLDCKSPWRRSPLWLLIRVVLQLVSQRLCKHGKPEDLYKHFMIYYMSMILDECKEKLACDDVYIMCAKIGRRLRKLDLDYEPTWLPIVQGTLQKANNIIQQKWDNVLAQNRLDIDIHPLKSLNFGKDIYCTLPRLDQWLQSIDQRQRSSTSVKFHPQPQLVKYRGTSLPSCCELTDQDYNTFNLAAFEDWVCAHLEEWLQENSGCESSCQQLGNLIEHYHKVALPLYSPNPEAFSIMLLTISELWVACDKSATQLHPMLKDYDSCIPLEMFESLALPHLTQMARLDRVEAYMKLRRSRVKYPRCNIFKSFGTSSCFAARYFDQSLEHQSLMSTIEERATREKAAKCSELELKKLNYRDLYAMADNMDCTYRDVVVDKRYGMVESRHSPSCRKCGYIQRADSINIEVHEWPLPSNRLEAKSTVFELNVPHPFAWWRETTRYVLDVLHVDYSIKQQPRSHHRPSSYRGLSSFYKTIDGHRRITLLSQNKPHLGTHRRNKGIIHVSASDVCLDNGMAFQYFDETVGCFTADFTTENETATTSCTYKLPQSSSSLQRFLSRPADRCDGPPPNSVIASQDACPEHMMPDEYKALCGLSFGIHIQWQNILRQLAMPSVVFKRTETCIFILQIINQAGPKGDDTVLRTGHVILGDDQFVVALLAEIRKSARRIEENWESWQEIGVLIFLTQRVLSLSDSTKIQNLCLEHLSHLRAICFRWVTLIRDKANTTVDERHRTDLMAQSARIALVCVSTFDCEESNLSRILEKISECSILIECCMLVHNKQVILDMPSNCLLPILFHRWQVLCYRYYRLMRDGMISIDVQTEALDQAIVRSWAAYRVGPRWSRASGDNDYWLVTDVVSDGLKDGGLCVHYNLLTGELLINGQPLASLPAAYERHDTYKTLFGRFLVEVMPSDVPGMQFSGQRAHMGQTIHLGKQSIADSPDSPDSPDSRGFDLRVRAMNEQGVWEFVPSRLLVGAFPDAFVQNFVHWYNLDRGYVEFRPATNPWQSSTNLWKLGKGCTQDGWCLEKTDGTALVSSTSNTAKLISTILNPIERASKLHCKLHISSSVLEIEIPRLRIDFSLQAGQSYIHSRQYRGMVIDNDQSLNTLVGLRSKLVLRHEKSNNRMVLVPEGNVAWERQERHAVIDVGWQAVTNIHAYSVDNQLGRLVDNGSLQSRLLLCYLHAVTSFCLPDPLTRKTGTEQSLSILRSASMRSFTQLQPENTALLAKLANLTPTRAYYPSNERVMQTVQWQNGISYLSQHDSFREEVAKIFGHDRRMGIFYPDTRSNLPPLPDLNTDLLHRNRIRSSTFRVSNYGAEDHTTKLDRVYSSLDRGHQSEGCTRVFTLCKIVQDEIAFTDVTTVQTVVSHLWQFLSQSDKVHGPDTELSPSKLKYDAMYILEPWKLVSAYWCSIHKLLCCETARPNKYQVMIWLSTLAFSPEANMSALKMLAAMYIIPEMGSHLPPRRPQFQLSSGSVMVEAELRIEFTSAALSRTPESELPPRDNEMYSAFKSRINNLMQSNRQRALNNFISELRLQWPTSSPSIPICQGDPKFHEYFDIQKVMNAVRKRFTTWYDNRELRFYLERMAYLLTDQPVQLVTMPLCPPLPCVESLNSPSYRFVSIDDIFDGTISPILDIQIEAPRLPRILSSDSELVDQAPRLMSLVRTLESQAKSNYETRYVKQLRTSLKSLQDIKRRENIEMDDSSLREVISIYLETCKTHCARIYNTIIAQMTFAGTAADPSSESEQMRRRILQILANGPTWPRLSPELLLQQLTWRRWRKLTEGWKRCFIAYGCSITALQRAKRLLGLIGGYREDLIQELRTPGHSSWDPYEFPESLLLEIENGILIRDVQEQIAQKMRDLQSGQNAVMQLNMGEGKSSVIVPVVAAWLANGSRLVRVLVAKPQSRQMLQMLISKLGGLLGRRIYHLPVSRSLRIGMAEAEEIERMCHECMDEGGILLVQPEHILSFKLMCLECSITGKKKVARSIMRTLAFFKMSSRDVVDESDENFSVRFELIYTMGSQQPLEFSPQRWVLIQQVLDLLRRHAVEVKKKFPRSIEVDEHSPGSFPRVRLLYEDASTDLLERIAKDVCENGVGALTISRQPEQSRSAILLYLLNAELSTQQIQAVENDGPASFWTESTKDLLLLMRGLLAGGILAFSFGQKRWRVNYGPDHTRRPSTNLSVPYRAKDNPAPRSEFSHPDVVIVLTCLNYYYGGLSDEELFLAFNHLVGSDQAETEFQIWVNDAPKLPMAYRQLGGINLQDQHHCLKHVFPNFRMSKGAIDYFLGHIIFPKELKEFPSKLSASGWDIGEIKTHPTVGFSGTNDSRVTLPLSVEQLDLPEQNHTNALVLEYILRPENAVTLLPARDNNSSRSDAELLLGRVVHLDPPIQVILDVGAQILEMTNLEVAQAWLKMTPGDGCIQAVVFVNSHDVICVVDRNGVIEPLQVSPFAQQLEACFVFLDEAHTRGIDLRLPPNYRAAVTLGAGITKDKLVQGTVLT
jgi:Protein of unknown function (DUF3638)/Protein of unknown function (DUF3645)